MARNGVTKLALNSPWCIAASYRSVVTASGKMARRCSGCSIAASSWVIAK